MEKDEIRQSETGIEEKITEQLRTIAAKKRFLSHFQNSFCILRVSIEMAVVSRATVYRWRKEDTQFRKAMDHSIEFLDEMMEDKLKEQMLSNNFAAVRFYLSKRHPDYRRTGRAAYRSEPIKNPYENMTEEEKLGRLTTALAARGKVIIDLAPQNHE
ncbi:MAG: hypothetical protein FJZ63_04280 [Chlamydiae bacterium]|nr:hypothetical protein [Chlamydiota bacterium]